MRGFKHRDVREAYLQLCVALGRTAGSEVGQWNLAYRQDHYRVEVEMPGGKICPVGDTWRNAKDFIFATNFALLTLNVYTEGATAEKLGQRKLDNESSSD